MATSVHDTAVVHGGATLGGGVEIGPFAVIGPEEVRVPVAAYTGFEGWADPGEWREFTEDLARSLGVEARLET